MNINLKPSKLLNIIVFLMCSIAVSSAVAIQFFYKLNPCSICILTRYIIIFIGLLNLISFFISNTFVTKILKDFSFLLAALGAGYSLRHIYIIHKKNDTCSTDNLQMLINNSPLANLFPTIFQSTGSCLDSNFLFMGTPFSLITFGFYVILITLILGFYNNQKNY